MPSRGCLPSLARSHARTSSSWWRKMRSQRGSGAVGSRLSALLPSRVAPMRYRGHRIASSARCAFITPSRFLCLATLGLTRLFPDRSHSATRDGQGTHAHLEGHRFGEQCGSSLPVGNMGKLNSAMPLKISITTGTAELSVD